MATLSHVKSSVQNAQAPRRARSDAPYQGALARFTALLCLISGFLFLPLARIHAAGVTIITHGQNSDVKSWITGIANAIPGYPKFPGTNFSTYEVRITRSGVNYLFTTTRTAGSAPALTDSGEIIVKLDWSTLAAGLDPDSTYKVGWAACKALLQTNLISELNGHALTEFPLHLIGHSRGGSLVCELSQHLGTNGVWVDQLTTLDPHPANNDGFHDPVSAVDAPARTYANVFFHDNYYETEVGYPTGEPVAGAYIRFLSGLTGGYGSSHSDVHLWYYGTIDGRQPTDNAGGTLTAAERTKWWTASEQSGALTGFYFSLIGGGDRLSTAQPSGQGQGMIRDGVNQWWDFGAGVANNRTALARNNGNWPNLITFHRETTNALTLQQTLPLRFAYQWSRPEGNLATLGIYLDADANPLNTNQILLQQLALPANGSAVSFTGTNLLLNVPNLVPGTYSLLGRITGGGRTRFLYAPERVQILAEAQPPTLGLTPLTPTQHVITVRGAPGQTIVLQDSTNLLTWRSLLTNTLTAGEWMVTNQLNAGESQRFYRSFVP